MCLPSQHAAASEQVTLRRRRQWPASRASRAARRRTTAAEAREIQKRKRVASRTRDQLVDCYPYAFSPLLLFAPSGAFRPRGYSNYHAVAQFFSGVLEVDMLTNVLADRKNMLYEELLEYVQSQADARHVLHRRSTSRPSNVWNEVLWSTTIPLEAAKNS